MPNDPLTSFDDIPVFLPGDRVTDAATKTLRGTIVEPTPPITAKNVGRGNVLVQWDHLSGSQPERAHLMERVAE